ncbi:MAG: hypothetical protein ILA02_02830 [Clostridia bacterium]|nr:hypothetical protein [Clostridia bacterium]
MKKDGYLIILIGVILAFIMTICILFSILGGVKIPIAAYCLYFVPAVIICIGTDMKK